MPSSIDWFWIEKTVPKFCISALCRVCTIMSTFCGCSCQVFLLFFFFAYRSIKDQTSQGVSEHQNFVFFLLCFYFLPFSDQSKSLSSVRLQFLQVCDCGGSCVCVSPFLPFFLSCRCGCPCCCWLGLKRIVWIFANDRISLNRMNIFLGSNSRRQRGDAMYRNVATSHTAPLLLATG